jgi:hypothetical protein
MVAVTESQCLGVDRTHDGTVIRGMVIAQEGPFKSKGRGAFDEQGLRQIAALCNQAPKGLISRLGHPDMLGASSREFKVLGRMRNFRMDKAVNRDGQTVPAVRADLHLAEYAMNHSVDGGSPAGRLVADMLDEDPASLSTSLVLRPNIKYQNDAKGRPMKGSDGEPLPPLWYPLSVEASDVVGVGEAVDSALATAERLAASGLEPEETFTADADSLKARKKILLDEMVQFQKEMKGRRTMTDADRRRAATLQARSDELLAIKVAPPAPAPVVEESIVEEREERLEAAPAEGMDRDVCSAICSRQTELQAAGFGDLVFMAQHMPWPAPRGYLDDLRARLSLADQYFAQRRSGMVV